MAKKSMKIAQTSREAYEKLTPDKLRGDYKKIIGALAIIEEGTSEQIAAKLKCKPDKIWKRLSELKAINILYKPGNRRPLKSGCNGYTWMLTEYGKQLVESNIDILPGKPVQDFSRALNQPKLNTHNTERLF